MLALLASGCFILYFIFEALYYACFIEETLSLASAIKVGARDVVSMTREQYLERLTWLKEALRFSSVLNQDEYRKTMFARVSKVWSDLKLDRADGTLRRQPYCIVLCGPPGSGKTGTAMKIAATLIKSKYGKFYKTDVVTLNETDQFQSEYRSSHKVVIFDDLASTNVDKEVVNPFRKVIDFVNNIRKTSLNPNVEMKGTVYIEPEIVIITTNMVDRFGPVAYWNNCPGAIIRRFSQILELCPDHENCYVYDFLKPSEAPRDQLGFNVDESYSNHQLYLSKQKDMVSIDSYINLINNEFLNHQIDQNNHINNINSIFDKVTVSNNWFVCAMNDFRRTHNFIVPSLSKEHELMLPWYSRLYRKCCIQQQSASAQASSLSADAPMFEPQSGTEESFSAFREIGFHEESEAFKTYVLAKTFQPDFFVLCYPCLYKLRNDRFALTEFGFVSSTGVYIVVPGMSPEIPKNEGHVARIYFTFRDLELYTHLKIQEFKEDFQHIQRDHSDQFHMLLAALKPNTAVDSNPLTLIPHSFATEKSSLENFSEEMRTQDLAIKSFSGCWQCIAREIDFQIEGRVVSCDLLFQHKERDNIFFFVEVHKSKQDKVIAQARYRKDVLSQISHNGHWHFGYYTAQGGGKMLTKK